MVTQFAPGRIYRSRFHDELLLLVVSSSKSSSGLFEQLALAWARKSRFELLRWNLVSDNWSEVS